MDLWQGKLGDFVRAASSGAIAGDMTGQYVRLHRTTPGMAEIRSWEHSLAALATLLTRTRLTDVGVAVGAPADRGGSRQTLAAEDSGVEVGVCAEYHLPLTGRRVDVMLFGEDGHGTANGVVVELKQWSQIALGDEFATNVLVGGNEHPHPSQQALDYAGFLADYHGAFAEGAVSAAPLAWCHNMTESASAELRDERFAGLLGHSPLFTGDDSALLSEWLTSRLQGGGGLDVLDAVTGGGFRPGKQVIDTLEAVLRQEEEWHLLDTQRVAHGAILAEVRRLQAKRGRAAVLVRGGPGTGKTVIAVQLLADALALGLKAMHSTGGKAFTTALRSRFKNAKDLFGWNMNLRDAPTQGLDLLLVDEAHRIRKNSDMRWTPKTKRADRSQVQEMLDAAKVTVFLLDENQFMRPDEIGTSALIHEATSACDVKLSAYDLQTQFRCGGCEEYVAWVDHLLGFREDEPPDWGDAYDLALVETPAALDALLASSAQAGERARLLAGFCWTWSDPAEDNTLAKDVVIGDWQRAWNAKEQKKKSYRPDNHPYTLWATTDAGLDQVGCIYSAQGFEFDRVGVIWGEDLVWRTDRWVAQKEASHDRPVRSSDRMLDLVRNAYRVLMTRGIRGTTILCLDPETRDHVRRSLEQTR